MSPGIHHVECRFFYASSFRWFGRTRTTKDAQRPGRPVLVEHRAQLYPSMFLIVDEIPLFSAICSSSARYFTRFLRLVSGCFFSTFFWNGVMVRGTVPDNQKENRG